MSYDTEELKRRGVEVERPTKVERVNACGCVKSVFVPSRLLLSLSRCTQSHARGPIHDENPALSQRQIRYTRRLPKLSVEDSSSSKGSKPNEAVSKNVLERIKLMRQEFEELLFLKYAAETLKDFKKRLLQERWD